MLVFISAGHMRWPNLFASLIRLDWLTVDRCDDKHLLYGRPIQLAQCGGGRVMGGHLGILRLLTRAVWHKNARPHDFKQC